MTDNAAQGQPGAALLSSEAIRASIIEAFRNSQRFTKPYRHWMLEGVLPDAAARAVNALPIDAPVIDDTQGKRDTHNSTRVFFSTEMQAAHPVCAGIAQAMQHPEAVAAIAEETGAKLAGSSLRIEYCMDRGGFWLEPHTDIGPKRITFQVYLNEGPGAETLGTDIYEVDEAHALFGRANAAFNHGFVFVPGPDTWHGFQERPVSGVRKSLIFNYVGPEWRSRHELAFPNDPV